METGAVGRRQWLVYLWPGLPWLWARGSWSALAVAVGFAALVNLALLSSLVWSELLAPSVRTACWTAVVAIWGSSAALCYGWDRRRQCAGGQAVRAERRFEEALGHYLQGNWFEAERALVGLLRHDPRDIDARLMVATLLRHTGRLDEAARQLDQLQRLEDARKWQWEIGCERQRLAEARAEAAEGARQDESAVGQEDGEPVGTDKAA
jgi:tetratricopeptide (TPR) repeat protein